MVRLALLIAGILLLIVQLFIQPVSAQVQIFIFLTGIVLLGVPHGAADLLVASQNARDEKKSFSKLNFHMNYMGRLILFGTIFWLFPLAGNLLFILFAAYHFGETDLYQFKTDTFVGKLFVVSYGLVILGVILLKHFEELKPLFQFFDAGIKQATLINWIHLHRYIILCFLGLLFLATMLFYFLFNDVNRQNKWQFLVQFPFIVLILYHLPMVLGFTFYFIVWHSILSLRNIVGYLRKDGLVPPALILMQISKYSILAIAGIILFGLSGFMFVNNSTLMIYVFLGLAVLTAPHMQIMHDMYISIRANCIIAKEL